MNPVAQDSVEVRDHSVGPPRRPRVLLLAYACSPEHGSEPGVGWNRALQTARYCDTWVICEQSRYEPPIRRYLETQGPIPGLQFLFIPRIVPWGWLGSLPGLSYPLYNLWQRRAYREAVRLHAEVGFDLVHQLTFCGYREPSYLGLLGVPFVWGPVGGTQNYPWRFLGLAEPAGAIREALRSVVNRLQLHCSPRIRRAARTAAVVIAANTTIQTDLARALRISPLLQLDAGVPEVADSPQSVPGAPGKLRILWSGDFGCWKTLPLLLRALAQVPADVACLLTVLGRGSLERRWQGLARRYGVAERMNWLGWLPFHEAQQQYARADVLAFTSLRDTFGCVVLEALAQGLPVICLDHQGVRDVVTPECGIKVPVTRPAEVIARLAEAITLLARDPARREQLGRGALARARDYLWDRQGERMAAVYRQILKGRPVTVQEAVVEKSLCPDSCSQATERWT